MLIVDLSQVMISNLHAQIGRHSIEVDEDLLRHMILNKLRSIYVKFRDEYGEMVIACDSANNWRKAVFPYYKASRRASQEKSLLDWNSIFNSLNNIRDEIKEYLPYRVIRVENSEADDVIAALVFQFGRQLGGSPILIVSGDKDFKQLQKFANVDQYDPVHKRWLKASDPEEFLYEHIMTGDQGDGIPNFLSPDDTFVTGVRQKKLYKEKMRAWVRELLEDKKPEDVFSSEEQIRNFYRNAKLIDLQQVPDSIREKTLAEYESEAGKGRSKIFNYFIKYRLKNMTSSIGDF